MSNVTKRALSQSLKSLLTEKTLDKITIKEITDHCGVNRQTFYYHFQDVYALLEYLFVMEGDSVISDKRTCDNWQEGLLEVFYYLKRNRNLVMHALQHMNREHLEAYLYKHVQKLLSHVIEENMAELNVSEADKHFIANFYKYAFVGMVLDWLKNQMKESPEYIVDHMSQLLEGSFRRSLEKFSVD